MTASIADEIRSLEQQRCRALVEADWDALASLVSDDVVHTHANGLVENKAAYLEGVRTKLEFLEVERLSLTVRAFGEAAIATGMLRQKIRVKAAGAIVEMRAATTQTWVRHGGQWVQNTFQATRVEH